MAVNGQDITKLSHKQVTALIRETTELRVWLSVCESENYFSSTDSSFSSPQKGSYIYASTPIINTDLGDSPTKKSHNLLNNSLGSQLRPFNGSAMIPVPQYGSLPKVGGFSPLGRKVMTQNEAAYVTFVPPSTYTVTRLSTVLSYCGPVKIPESWSNRGVSSLCIQECARQLLSKRKTEDFIKVQFEVSQRSLKITNTGGVVLAKHLRQELYYCGLCSSDERYFAVVTRSCSDESVGQAQADLCHVFKLMSDSKLSTYCIDRAKSEREMRSGQPSFLNSCVNIIEAIQNIFQSETHNPVASLKRGVEATDGVDYGVIRGIPTLQISGSGGSTDSLGSSPLQPSPLLRRKKSNVVDLRVKETSSHNRQRSISIPINAPTEYTIPPIATTSSAGYVRSQASNEIVHIRMGSDGSNSSNSSTRSRPLPILRGQHPPEDKAKRVSDSSLSSMSSDHSGHRSGSQSPTSKNTSGSFVPVHNPHSHCQHVALGRKQSQPARTGAVSPAHNGSRPHQLRRQVSFKYLRNMLYRL